jgi:hypothetical protein
MPDQSRGVSAARSVPATVDQYLEWRAGQDKNANIYVIEAQM